MQNFRETLLRRIHSRMAARFSRFLHRHYSELPATDSYVCVAPNNLFWHIVPKVGKHMTFSAEVCWMKTERSPIWARIGTPDDVPNDDGLRFGISLLWSHDDTPWAGQIDDDDAYWDDGLKRLRKSEVAEQCGQHPELYPDHLNIDEKQLFVLIEDLMNRVHDFAIPYLENVSVR